MGINNLKQLLYCQLIQTISITEEYYTSILQRLNKAFKKKKERKFVKTILLQSKASCCLTAPRDIVNGQDLAPSGYNFPRMNLKIVSWEVGYQL